MLKDTEIWEQLRRGDKDVLAALFESTSDRLFRYGMKFTHDEELVKDSIQDLFLKLHQNRTELPKDEQLIFYLFKILKNILIDALRKKEKIIYLSPHKLPFYVKFAFNQTDENEYNEEIKERFEKVIELLSDRQKEAIYLRFHAELSYEEISQLLGINYQSARNLIHRSIEKIRSEMDLNLFLALFMCCR